MTKKELIEKIKLVHGVSLFGSSPKEIATALISSGIVTVEPEPVREFWVARNDYQSYITFKNKPNETDFHEMFPVHDSTQCNQWHDKWKKLKEWVVNSPLSLGSSIFLFKIKEIENE